MKISSMTKTLKISPILLLMLSSSAFAQRFDITTDIGQIRYHEAGSVLASTWKKAVWFGLEDSSLNMNCPKYKSKYAIAIPDDNETNLIRPPIIKSKKRTTQLQGK
jgi:hypothetical protein|tara:strand:+ start:127 stop:444 length:318 start_codon:yes stop_codon:yes gene_type:complete